MSRRPRASRRLRMGSRPRMSHQVSILRAAAAGPAWVVAAALVAARPVAGVAALAGLGAVSSLAGAVAPRWPWATVTLVALTGGYAAASQPAPTPVRVAASLGMAAVLWSLHVTFAATAEIPARAAIEPALVKRLRTRILVPLVVGLPVTALTGALGALAPTQVWLRAVGLVAAVAVAAGPGLLTHRPSQPLG